ncbi:MAG: DNA-binding protein [Bacillaceae bacterium]|nr:DNA-binding protein [Bacillaceae bacterium]
MKKLTVNMLLRYKETNDVERVVWISPDCSICFVIDVNKNRFPVLRNVNEILNGIVESRVEIVEQDDWVHYVHEKTLSAKEIEIRDRAWKVISMIASSECEPAIFFPHQRRKLIQQASEKLGISVSTIERYLKRYWKFGKTKNALIPDLRNCGAKGKDKPVSSVKRGRPNLYGQKGINVDEEMKKIFQLAMKKFYYKQNKPSLRLTYELMVKDLILGKDAGDANKKIPSFRQFYYWVEKERSIQKEISTRQSYKEYLLNYRPLLGNASMETSTIGTYQIDATVADVYLVSKFNRNLIIGRPVIYYCVDVFSRLVTGIYVGLEGPSWIGAMMCLLNSVEDKVEFCKKYGIHISKEEWSPSHLPYAIVADRGELMSRNAEELVQNLGIRIQNTGTFRADLKGIIEQYFRLTNMYVKPFLPGSIDTDFQKRGARDYRLDAKLDIDQFTQFIIYCVLYYNNHYYLKNYNKDEMLIREDIPAIPIYLWNWAMDNRAGMLKQLPLDIVKLNLLPRSTAVVTPNGIRFQGMYYSCRLAVEEKWFVQARLKGNWKVDVSYDPRCVNTIYLRHPDGRNYDVCRLLDHQTQFKDKAIEDVIYMMEYEKLQQKEYEPKQLESKVKLLESIENIVKQATKATKEGSVEQSKSARLKGISMNRQLEKELLRVEQVVKLSDDTKVNETSTKVADDYFYNIDLFK